MRREEGEKGGGKGGGGKEKEEGGEERKRKDINIRLKQVVVIATCQVIYLTHLTTL